MKGQGNSSEMLIFFYKLSPLFFLHTQTGLGYKITKCHISKISTTTFIRSMRVRQTYKTKYYKSVSLDFYSLLSYLSSTVKQESITKRVQDSGKCGTDNAKGHGRKLLVPFSHLSHNVPKD